jgi:hypothetical protein
MKNDSTKTVTITGNTFPVKDQIKALGGRWNADAKGWAVPASKADEARALVSGGPRAAVATHAAPRKCRCCGAKELGSIEAARLGKKTGMQHYPVKLRRDGICWDCASDT